MKRYVLFMLILLFPVLSSAQNNQRRGVMIQGETLEITVTVWSNTSQYGEPKVYYGGKYKGKVTSFYKTNPGVGASGCVSFKMQYNYNTGMRAEPMEFRFESDEGYVWHRADPDIQLVGKTGGTLRIYCNGERSKYYNSKKKNSNKTSYNSGRASYSSYSNSDSYNNSGSSVGAEIGRNMADGLTNVVSRAMYVEMKGYPNLQIQAGYSTRFGEFAGIGTNLGGAGGVYLQGAVYKDLFAEEKPKGLNAWAVRLGYYGGDTYDTFNLNIVILNSDLLVNKYSSDGKYAGGLELAYTHYFTRRLGLMGGVGFTFFDKPNKKTGTLFEANICLTYRLFSK